MVRLTSRHKLEVSALRTIFLIFLEDKRQSIVLEYLKEILPGYTLQPFVATEVDAQVTRIFYNETSDACRMTISLHGPALDLIMIDGDFELKCALGQIAEIYLV